MIHFALYDATYHKSSIGNSWFVMHPANDAILAYCDTEEEAKQVVKRLNETLFIGQKVQYMDTARGKLLIGVVKSLPEYAFVEWDKEGSFTISVSKLRRV